jgi:DNA polymerase elongation subunit (family B)
MLDEIPNNTTLARIVKEKFKLDSDLDTIRRRISTIRSSNTFAVKKPIKRLFFDIETSYAKGWFWRPQYNTNIDYSQIDEHAKIICISYKWQYEDKVHNLKWTKDCDDKQMLIDFTKIMLKADEIVGHNSDRFDEKWIRTRCIFHRIPALPKYKSLDTLKKAKSHFNFPSNRLDYIGDYLGVGRKLETEKGLWQKVIKFNNREALQRMVDYCDQDVFLLESIYEVMMPYIYGNTNFSTLKGGEKFNCIECGSEHVVLVRTNTTPAGTLQRVMECQSCEKNYNINNSTYQKHLQYIVMNGIK